MHTAEFSILLTLIFLLRLIMQQVYETLTGVKVEGRISPVSKDDLLRLLPSEWPEDPTEDLIAAQLQSSSQVLVVLDDDPTGTQTVHDIEVLTEW